MLITYQYKLNPTPEQASTMEAWGELLRRHYSRRVKGTYQGLNPYFDWRAVSPRKALFSVPA